MAQAKILIADDDTLVREAVYKILSMFGHVASLVLAAKRPWAP